MISLKNRMRFLFLLVAAVLFVGCSQKSLTIITNIQEVGYAVEVFNATNSENITTIIHDNPYVQIANTQASIVISDIIPTQAQKDLLETNEFLEKENRIHTGNQHLTLLAFSIPLIIIKKSENLSLSSNNHISLSQLRNNIQDLSKRPVYNDKWIFPAVPEVTFSQVFSNKTEYEQWMDSVGLLEKTVQDTFNFHYETIPPIAVLNTAEIVYKYVPSHVFFNQSESFRTQFSIAILKSSANKVPIVDPVFIGIVKDARYPNLQKKVLTWLLTSKNQKEILNFTRKNFRSIPSASSFLGRSYSTLLDTNSSELLLYNSYLFKYGPLYSSLYLNVDSLEY